MERAFHLPGLKRVRTRPVTFGVCALAIADLSVDETRHLLASLRRQAARGETADRAAGVARAARRFLDPDDRFRHRALEALPGLTGFSRAMIEETLPRVFAPLADAEALAKSVSTAGRVVELLGIVAAGNIPGVALLKTAFALTAGAACVVKVASGEPLLTALFAEALDTVDASLASALAVSWWQGGSSDAEDAVVRGVD
jgi:acyl-CoA reductase-like NAD-dependent aldehyde dehydrogenase